MEQSGNTFAECLSCGTPLTGRYCSTCGEKTLQDDEKTVSHYLMHALHALTHADGKFFRSLALIFFRPGTLSVNYLQGKRKGIMSPIAMFLFANLLYLFLSPFDALTSTYYSQRGQLYASTAEQKFEQKKKARGWSEIQISQRYNAKSAKLSKLLLILLVMFFSVPLALIYYSPKRYFIDHVVFSTEVINFLILVVFLILPWLLSLIFSVLRSWFAFDAHLNPNGETALISLTVGLITYLSVGSHRVYRPRWWMAVMKSVFLFVGLFFSVVAYRFVLFQTTMLLL
jgi:hypothetical protein